MIDLSGEWLCAVWFFALDCESGGSYFDSLVQLSIGFGLPRVKSDLLLGGERVLWLEMLV